MPKNQCLAEKLWRTDSPPKYHSLGYFSKNTPLKSPILLADQIANSLLRSPKSALKVYSDVYLGSDRGRRQVNGARSETAHQARFL
jgi:hypothetical protein